MQWSPLGCNPAGEPAVRCYRCFDGTVAAVRSMQSVFREKFFTTNRRRGENVKWERIGGKLSCYIDECFFGIGKNRCWSSAKSEAHLKLPKFLVNLGGQENKKSVFGCCSMFAFPFHYSSFCTTIVLMAVFWQVHCLLSTTPKLLCLFLSVPQSHTLSCSRSECKCKMLVTFKAIKN